MTERPRKGLLMKSEKSLINNSLPVSKPKRNGKIELLRFVFSIIIVLLHTSLHFFDAQRDFTGVLKPGGFSFNFAEHGAIIVEFFFLVSGFLMAKKVFKLISQKGKRISGDELVLETWHFEKSKFLSFFPQHAVAFVFVAIGYVLVKKYNLIQSISHLIKGVPTFFLTYMFGTATPKPEKVNPPIWYLSAMLIAMLFIYPFLRKYYRAVTRYAGPVLAVGIMAVIFWKTQSLDPVLKVIGFGYEGLLRAIAEMLMGCTAFEISRWLAGKKLSPVLKGLLTVYEAAVFIGVIVFSFTNLKNSYDFLILVLMFTAVPITFSNQTYFGDLFNNKICYFLGKCSLSIYLVHMFPVFVAERYLKSVSGFIVVPLILVCTVLLSFFVDFGGKKLLGIILKPQKKAD